MASRKPGRQRADPAPATATGARSRCPGGSCPPERSAGCSQSSCRRSTSCCSCRPSSGSLRPVACRSGRRRGASRRPAHLRATQPAQRQSDSDLLPRVANRRALCDMLAQRDELGRRPALHLVTTSPSVPGSPGDRRRIGQHPTRAVRVPVDEPQRSQRVDETPVSERPAVGAAGRGQLQQCGLDVVRCHLPRPTVYR